MVNDSPRERDIQERTFTFACRVIDLCEVLFRRGRVASHLAGQLLDAGTSVGANMMEADAGQTKPDFIAKTCIARKEVRESHYWLRLIAYAVRPNPPEVNGLRDEASQLDKILSKIVYVARSTPKRG